MSVHVLLADDEPLIRQSLRSVLVQEGFVVTAAATGEEAWRSFQSERPDVVLLDLILGDIDGLEVLRRIKQLAPETKVVVLSAHGTIERAVAAMKLGAYEFIRKPFELEEILAAVRNAARTSRLEGRIEYLSQRERSQAGARFIPSLGLQGVLREVQLMAESPVATVLVLGESGVGKQHIARLVHDLSLRASGPFVELNCSAIPENLVESELFGYERGAFSDARERKLGLVEVADGGTLFLDEVGDLGAAAQAKLLTFLEQRSFRRVGGTALRHMDTRVVAATNRDLAKLVTERSFRTDLWYRLNGMTLSVPPLRARPADVVPLAEHFLEQASRDFNRRWKGISSEARELLLRYSWPGNIRELKSVINRAALLHNAEMLAPQHLPLDLFGVPLSPLTSQAPIAADGNRISTLAEVELLHIRRVLEFVHGNRTLAAQHLGITRQTLAKKVDSSAESE